MFLPSLNLDNIPFAKGPSFTPFSTFDPDEWDIAIFMGIHRECVAILWVLLNELHLAADATELVLAAFEVDELRGSAVNHAAHLELVATQDAVLGPPPGLQEDREGLVEEVHVHVAHVHQAIDVFDLDGHLQLHQDDPQDMVLAAAHAVAALADHSLAGDAEGHHPLGAAVTPLAQQLLRTSRASGNELLHPSRDCLDLLCSR
ncbi:hypothetical protein SELMODRAFT_414680 [Selaginella moellendorffii]|uniref:Uncharacterized protein n=1 Tax=Selaginella moellendorffii TaxID=88036 RepID=D8RTK3_SELML|nr:hypothetical protein SELMODRAFT_414680 [Selaginella moellendorffii]